jgi:hypothetical protein
VARVRHKSRQAGKILARRYGSTILKDQSGGLTLSASVQTSSSTSACVMRELDSMKLTCQVIDQEFKKIMFPNGANVRNGARHHVRNSQVEAAVMRSGYCHTGIPQDIYGTSISMNSVLFLVYAF